MIIVENIAIMDVQKRQASPRIALVSYRGIWNTGDVLSLNTTKRIESYRIVLEFLYLSKTQIMFSANVRNARYL